MISMSMIKSWFGKNQPALMLGVGIAGMVTTTVLAVRGHMKAKEEVGRQYMNNIVCGTSDMTDAQRDSMYEEHGYSDKNGHRHIKKRYWIKKTWKCYVPAAVTGSLSIACLIGSYSINHRRNAALASSLAVSEAAMTEYQKHVVDTIGEEAEKGIREKFQADQIKKSGPLHSPAELLPGEGDHEYMDGAHCVNCYESTTQQKFWASKEDIRRAVNNLNQDRLTGFGGQVTLNDFYNEIGITATSVGDTLGWDVDHPIEVDISAVEVNGIPCLYINPMNWVSLI